MVYAERSRCHARWGGHRASREAARRPGPPLPRGDKPVLSTAATMQHPIYTIGHSTRSVEEMVELLREAGADLVADVRTIPRSRTNPQFNADALPETLGACGVAYRPLPNLGGLRRRAKGAGASPNGFWENDSFRNYADYALTPAFREGLAD